jgi:hypothetical protein
MTNKLAFVLAVTTTLHHTTTPYLHGDGPSAPPRAAVTLTSSANSSVGVVTNTVTGFQYNTAPDPRRLVVTFASS